MGSLWIHRTVIICIWLFTICLSSIEAAVHHRSKDMYFTSGYDWCLPGGSFLTKGIEEEFVWLWIAAFASVVLYVPLFFIVKGVLDVDTSSGHGLRIRWKDGVAPYLAGEAHLKVLLYPIAYTILVVPLSIVRQANFKSKPPSASVFAVSTLFQLTGLVNVILFLGFRGSATLLSSPGDDNPQRGVMGMDENGKLRSRNPMDDTHTIELLSVPDAGLPD